MADASSGTVGMAGVGQQHPSQQTHAMADAAASGPAGVTGGGAKADAASAPTGSGGASGEAAGDLLLRVLTYNLLAPEFTNHDAGNHGGKKNARETPAQTSARLQLAWHFLAQAPADVLLLQEVSPLLFGLPLGGGPPPTGSAPARVHAPEGAPAGALSLCSLFHAFAAFAPDGSPGTAVLLRKASPWAPSPTAAPFCVAGGEHSGGGSKSATLVPLAAGGRACVVCSIHTTWDGKPELRLAQLAALQAALRAAAPEGMPRVIGGDFNCHPPSPHFAGLVAAPPLAGLRRAAGGAPTHCGRVLDHLFYSESAFRASDLEVQQGLPLSAPYAEKGAGGGPVGVVSASDHAHVLLHLTCR